MMKIDMQLEDAIRTILGERATDASICPSEAARQVGGPQWRSLMDPARRAAQRLAQAGEVEISQRGTKVDMGAVKGPVRIRRAR